MHALGILYLAAACGGTVLAAAMQAPAMKAPFSPAVVAGDTVYLAGMLPTDGGGRIVPGDAGAQTTRVLENLAGLLKQHGSRIEQVASVTVYLKSADDFPTMNAAYAKFWRRDPPARTTVIVNLVVPDALLEISMIALRDGVERRVIHPAGWLRSPNPYSYAVLSKDTLYLSGLVSRNGRDNAPVPGDVSAQMETELRNASEILGAAGMTLADVVSSRVYLTDSALFQDMNSAYRRGFPASPPARATVRAGLTAPQYVVETTFVAVKDARRQAITTPNPDGSAGQVNPNLSSAIRVGDRVYLSGVLGVTDTNGTDVAAQTKEALARMGRTLRAAGATWEDVVDAAVYLPNLNDFATMNSAYQEVFKRRFPARATVGAGLMSPTGLVEIMATAVRHGN